MVLEEEVIEQVSEIIPNTDRNKFIDYYFFGAMAIYGLLQIPFIQDSLGTAYFHIAKISEYLY
jgi:hypothetical protein